MRIMILYWRERGVIMFEIRCKKDVDIKMFEVEYNKNIGMLNYLKDNFTRLDEILDEIGYSSCFEMISFLKLCEENYMVSLLLHSLVTYCHRKEDETFLDLYSEFQNGEMESWFENCSITDLNQVKRCLLGDSVISEAFPEIVSYVFKKEKKI